MPEKLKKIEKQVSTATAQFGLDFINTSATDTSKNVVISPFSLQNLLNILLLGATDGSETQKQLAKVLNYDKTKLLLHEANSNVDNTKTNLLPHEATRDILLEIMKRSDKYKICRDICLDGSGRLGSSCMREFKKPVDGIFTNANSILTNRNYAELSPEYKEVVEKYYSEIYFDQFDSTDEDKVVHRVNNWVKDKTENMIKKLLDKVDTQQINIILLNATYFKSEWWSPFEKRHNRKKIFYNNGQDDDVSEVYFMRKTCNFRYVDLSKKKLQCQVLEMRFRDDDSKKFSMVLMLPSERKGITKLQANLDANSLNKIYTSLPKKEIRVKVVLPKFAFEDSYKSCKEILTRMGLKGIFSPGEDFYPMFNNKEGVGVSDLVHKITISVDELGTEAAAITYCAGLTGSGCKPPKPKPKFFADHPFLFVIRHIESNMPLFMGRVSKL